jgi:ABC-type amino acid transport system permease subunit
MSKELFVKKAIAIVVFVFGFIVGLSFAVMALWNNILVDVMHVGVINFWQALGIFGLAKILFGGFPGARGRWGGPGGHWKQHMGGMKEKWMNMTPEEREKFKQNWSSRCAGWRKPSAEQTTDAG